MAESSSSSSSVALVVRRPGDSWSFTDANETRISHRWTIKKFPLLCHSTSKNKLRSLSFTGGGPAKWHLELDTKRHDYDKDYVHLSLHLDKPTSAPISAECKVYILNNRGKRCEEKTTFIESIRNKGCAWEANLIQRNELLKEQAEELLDGDRLTILCELRALLSPSDTITVMSPHITSPSNSLGADLGSLLEGGLYSDMTLVAEGKEFQVHRNILSARSPVFEAMFQHDMRESKEKKVDISDLSADTVQEMLQHIYTGEVSTLEQSAESLLEAADKYDLPSLKSACEETLRSKLEVKNVAKMLVLADKHHAEQLKADCMGVILSHPKEVQESEGWEDMKEQPVSLSLKQLTERQ